MQSYVHDPLTTISNGEREAKASELLKNLEEMFSRYCWLLRLHRMYHNNQSKGLNVYIIGIAIAIMKPFQFHSFFT